jgi:hypothetical protein
MHLQSTHTAYCANTRAVFPVELLGFGLVSATRVSQEKYASDALYLYVYMRP